MKQFLFNTYKSLYLCWSLVYGSGTVRDRNSILFCRGIVKWWREVNFMFIKVPTIFMKDRNCLSQPFPSLLSSFEILLVRDYVISNLCTIWNYYWGIRDKKFCVSSTFLWNFPKKVIFRFFFDSLQNIFECTIKA